MTWKHTSIVLLLTSVVTGYYFWQDKKKPEKPLEKPESKQKAVVPLPPPVIRPEGQLTKVEQSIIDQVLSHFKSKQYRLALEVSENAYQTAKQDSPFYNWLRRHLPIILTSNAWQQINNNNCSSAITLLKRAELFSNHPATNKGLALCYSRLKILNSAEEYFEKYLEQKPTDNAMSLLYSEALESALKYKKATEVLEKVVASSEEHGEAKKRLSSMREKAKEGLKQVTVSTSHFNLSYNPSNDYEFIDFILETLEFSLEEFISKYSFKEPKTPVEVILYPQDRFKKVLKHGPQWASGVFDGRIRVSIPSSGTPTNEKFNQVERILRHELTHALLASMTMFRTMPTWINEGIAQRLECAYECRRDFFSINKKSFLPEDALNKPFIELNSSNAQLSYLQSLYLILAIENDKELYGTNPIERIIAQIPNPGKLSNERLLKPINMTFKALHQKATNLWNSRTVLKPVP